MMKKIGIMSNLMTSYGGVQTCVISLIRGLNEQGIVPILICDLNPKKELWEEQGLECEFEKVKFSLSSETIFKYSKFLSPFLEFIFYFKTSWLKEKYDFIYLFEHNTIIDTKQKHLFYLSMSPRAHGFSVNKKLSKLKNIFYTIFLKKNHPIFEFQNYNCVINSQYTAAMFYDYFKKKITVINPSNTVEHNLPSIINKKEKTVLFLSRINPNKKVEKVIDLAKNHTDYTFYIIGSVDKDNEMYIENIKKVILQKELKNIIILQNLPHAEVTNYLAMCEYYIFFAQNEHFGITTVEALLYGCIPFVHNSGGQKEIVLEDRLRFEYETMEDKFNELLQISKIDKIILLKSLNLHVQNFKEQVFIDKMISYI